MNNQIREKKKTKKKELFGVWGLDFALLQIITIIIHQGRAWGKF